jgi:hypothetical protein
MKILVGITGKLGSGKDYITNNIVIPAIASLNRPSGAGITSLTHKYRYLQCAFADQLKINVMTKNYIDYKTIYEQKTPESRIFLQQEGTENGRRLNENIWVNYLDNWMTVHNHRGIDIFVISDVRFKNEHRYIKTHGGIILKVLAPTRNQQRLTAESKNCDYTYKCISTHSSECDLDDLDDSQYSMVIRNDPTDDFNIYKLRKDFRHVLEKNLTSSSDKGQFIINTRPIDLDQVM